MTGKDEGATILAGLRVALAPHGLIPRGGFLVRAKDGIPAFADGRAARSLVLIGHGGGDFWPAFAPFATGEDPHPLDSWSRRILDPLAQALGGVALYPFGGPPHWPFQLWARRAEAVYPSPLQILIHPEFGLWHAYRGAIALTERIEFPPRADRPSPCESCAEKPCLTACPVGAIRPTDFRADICRAHALAPEGAECRDRGCLARRACPIGRDYRYGPAQQAFHMRAFLQPRPR